MPNRPPPSQVIFDRPFVLAVLLTQQLTNPSIAQPPNRPPTQVIFDRPFVFAVLHGESGVPLFAAVVAEPSAVE